MAAKKPAKKKPIKPKFVNPVGRPRKWDTVPALQKEIDAYFASCWEALMDERLTKEAEEREKNKAARNRTFTDDDYEWKPRLNRDGEPLFKRIRPYTVTGLALALGTSRETLNNYEKQSKFFDTVKRAKLIIHNFTEEGFIAGDITPSAAIFSLKNNYGWHEEQTVKHDVADTLAALLTTPDDKAGSA